MVHRSTIKVRRSTVFQIIERESLKKLIECHGKNVPLGAYLEHDLLSESGVLLLRRGIIVDSKIKDILDRYTKPIIVSIEIPDEVLNAGADTEVADDKALNLDEDIKERALQGVEYMFANPTSNSSITAAKDIASMLSDVVNSSSAVNISLNNLKVSDDYTFKHSVDVATMATLVAHKLKLSKKKLEDVATAGILHDLGKTKIPNEILNKPGKLDDEEFKIMQQHPTYGYHLVESSKDLSDFTKTGILFHHEKVNGTGYPLGITTGQISLSGKLLTVVDVYDALVTKRPYRDNIIESAEAIEMMMGMHNQFDVAVMRAFLNCVIIYPAGTRAILSDSNVYTVVSQNAGFPLRPVVRNVLTGETIDLAYNEKYLNLTILSSL